jgi:peptidylprolyl isomerase
VNRLRPVLVALSIGALAMSLVSACAVATPPALTVGTYTLSRKDFLDELNTLTAAGAIPPVTNPTESQTTGSTPPSAYSPQSAAQVLNATAQYQLLHQLVAAQGLQTTDADKQTALALLGQRMSQSSQSGQAPTADQVQQTLAKYGPLQEVLMGQATDSATLERSLVSQDELTAAGQKLYDQQKDSLAQTCLSLFVAGAGSAPASATQQAPTPTDAEFTAAQAKAQAAKTKIDGGQAFADVAKTDSDQPDSAAQQCVTASQLQSAPPELVTAISSTPIGKVSDPVKVTELPGYVLVAVTSKQTPTYEQSKAQIEPTVRSQIGAQRVDDAVAKSADSATVTVDPLFGDWNRVSHQVTVPPGATAPDTATTAADLLNPTASTPTASAPATTAPANCTPATVTQPPAAQKPTASAVSGPAPTSLEVKDLTAGTGDAAKAGDKVTVEYVGVLAKDGTEFDSSWKRSQPFDFTLGAGNVIPGWDQGVVGMKVGGRSQLTIPASLAYGAQGQGSIGPNEALVFVVDLLQICSPTPTDSAASTPSGPAAAAGDVTSTTTSPTATTATTATSAPAGAPTTASSATVTTRAG